MTHLHKPLSAIRMAVRTAIILLVFVIIFTGLLSFVYLKTLPTIEAAASEEKMKRVNEVLPRSYYDNDLLSDSVRIEPHALLGLDEPSLAYRARRDNQTVALVIESVAPDGYAGKIRLILAFKPDGTLIGVRVTQHRETPGLADYIEPGKDRNKERPWITQFDGLSPATLSGEEWKVKKDGGRFDSVAGATVTPRAIVKAIRQAAVYVGNNQKTLFASH